MNDGPSGDDSPIFSFLVVVHDMLREAPRTLFSLSREYQRGARDLAYEVIVVDNHSSVPLGEDLVRSFGPEFRYVYLSEESVSPVGAINRAAREAKGRFLVVCIDGARILSPGIVSGMALASRLHDRPVISVLSWHLGPTLQNESLEDGYDQEAEDALLSTRNWREDGYALFEISCLAGSSSGGWFAVAAESNCLAVTREMFQELNGFDVGFRSPGGGLCNLDFLRRACDLHDTELICLLGEGTFHQFHGGVATNVPAERHPWPSFAKEYEELRGEPFRPSGRSPLYLGRIPPSAARFLCPTCGRKAAGAGAGDEAGPGGTKA